MHREAQPQTSDAIKSLPWWYWLLNFLSPNAVQLDLQPHSCLASETTPHSSSGWKSWITAPNIFMWRSSQGMCWFSQQLLPGGQVPPKPCEAYSKSEDCQILACNYDLSPTLCIDFMPSIPLSSVSVPIAGLWGNYHRQGKKKEKALSLLLPPTCPLCHKLPEHRANAQS